MTRLTQLSFLLTLGSALGSTLGCGDTTPVTTNQLNFDRPVDMAFACHGGLRLTGGTEASINQIIATSAMPTSGCETRAGAPVPIAAECWTKKDAQGNPAPGDSDYEQPTPFGQETLRELVDPDHPEKGCRIVTEDGVSGQVPIPSWYGLVLETGPGVVNVVKFDVTAPAASDADLNQGVLDSDPLTPGTNGISVGEEPVAIVTDPSGCYAITANAGSCDLSVLDLNSALDDSPGAQVDRLTVTNASGAPILARPAAMVGEPSQTQEEVGKRQCKKLTPADPTPTPTGLVYVAYPSCHLVAGVDALTGKIVAGIQYNAAGIPTIVDGNVTCPDECGGAGAARPGIRPVALSLEVDPKSSRRRLAIGADNSASITVVDLDDATRPLSLFQVALQNTTGALGVSRLSMSAEIGMGGGVFGFLDSVDDEAAGGTFQFVYAVATDGSVRVADVMDLRQECDTQVDARYARKAATVHDLACFPVGAPTTPPRRAGARGPGIRLPGDAIPLSVEFVRVDNLTTLGLTETRGVDFEKPATLVGYFAVVTASNGGVFFVNVDDDDYPDQFVPSKPLSVPIGFAMAHQLRDAGVDRNFTIDTEDQPYSCVHYSPGDPNYDPSDPNKCNLNVAPADDHSADDRGCDYLGAFQGTIARGGPRITDKPDRKAPAGTIAAEKLGLLPGIRQLLCDRRAYHGGRSTAADLLAVSELQYAAPDNARDVAFPDLLALPDAETWNLIWEGPLSLNVGDSNINGPQVRESILKVDAYGLHVLDNSKPFCDTGVEPFDILELRGCDPTIGSADCPSGYTCFVHPKSTSGFGSCMLSGEADRLANACQDFLTSSRHYTVSTAASGELLALPRRFALRTTPLDGCSSDAQCQTLADYAAREKSAANLCGDGICDLGRETVTSCSADCSMAGPVCGDGQCEGNETRDNCPTDCDHQAWSCVADPLRAPMGGTGKRCELTCSTTDDCASGTVCQGGFCMEGVIPPQSCINASQRYELHAGDAFSVIGSRTGFVHPIIADATGKCVRDPQANRLSIGRLPLVAGPCDPTADPLTGQLPNGTFEPNPCVATVVHDEAVPTYGPPLEGGRCAPILDNDKNPVLTDPPRERSAPAVRFRNRGMTFNLVDPYYPGDARCTADLQGNLGQIPQVVPGYTITFRQAGGFVPMQMFQANTPETRPSLPVKVVRGPTNTLWVVDEGDFLSTTTVPSTRGKIFRIQPLLPGGGLPIQ